jgi:hypothetical protein
MAADKEKLTANVRAFLSQETGRKLSAIKPSTKLGSLGLDGFAMVRLGEDINRMAWMHGVKVSVHDMIGLTTVKSLVDMLAPKL